jgi:hypothetical protein
MPIDSNIALGVKPVQIESPLNQMANVYALQNAQQSNQLNQLNLGEAQRKIEDRNRLRSTLGGFAKDMSVADQVNALVKGGYLDEARLLTESEAKVNKDKRETEKAASDLKANSIKFHRDLLPMVRDQASYEKWGVNAIKDIPELGKMLPAQYDPALIPQLAMSADKYIESQKPREVAPGNVVLGPDNKAIYTAPYKPEPSTDIPKLKPGEVWDAKKQTVMQVPGSAEYNKQSKVHGTDYNATKTVISKMDNAISKVNDILSPENKSGFEGNFGGYNAAITRQFTGNTAKVKKNIETVKADMKSAGLELVRSGGSIGALTEREWPMLEAQIDAIDYMLDEKDAEAAFKRVISTFERIKDQAKDTYQTTWGETQYFKPDAIKGAGKAPAAPVAPARKNVGSDAKAKPKATWSVEREGT